MPQPRNVRHLRRFYDHSEAIAYRDGLLAGCLVNAQPGSDPWRVRVELDNCAPYDWHVYVEVGRYDRDGNEVWG